MNDFLSEHRITLWPYSTPAEKPKRNQFIDLFIWLKKTLNQRGEP
ncbi:hypothetical protein SK355_02315 [Candidatus Fukatsuia symbiotica]|nr:hypothetical protein [Candidatus Fukatsuia symbiotica]MEA9444172.1 hypothetical protein [Candidatus Fukatsuia symbiotica]